MNRMTRVRLLSPLLALLLLTSATFAHADATETPASKLGSEGAELYKAHDYRAAIEKFSASYALDPDPNLLFNQGRCYEALGEKPTAVQKYKEFLGKQGGDVTARAKAQASIDKISAELNAPTPAGPTPAGPTPASANAAANSTAPGGVASSSSGGVHPLAIAGWSVTGALAIGAVVTGVLALGAASDIKPLTYGANDAASRMPLDDKKSSAKTLALVTDILAVSAIAVGGVSLYFTLAPRTKEPARGSVGVEGSF
jgi:hypothetical protein